MLHWFAVRLAQTGKKVGKEEKGFTLIELLVVVIIIGILAAIAIPTFLSQRDKATVAAAKANLTNAATAQQAYYADNGAYTSVTNDLTGLGFPQDGSVTIVTPATSTGSSFCMNTSSPAYKISDTGGKPQSGSC